MGLARRRSYFFVANYAAATCLSHFSTGRRAVELIFNTTRGKDRFVPELPEVETMRRGVLAVVGSQIRNIQRAACARRPIAISPDIPAFRRRTRGKTIVDVCRVGKRVILQLSSEDRIVIEPRMTGLVLLAEPPTREHLRLRLSLDGATPELLFWDRRGLGCVWLMSPAEFVQRLGEEKLGPDALKITAAELRTRLGASRRPIKVALLDQKAVAGIGNLYASEILHLARISPELACNLLRPKHWERLRQATLEVLEAAVLHEGSTLSDGTYRNALNEAGGYQNHHRVYDRAGDVCRSCGKREILRIVQAQRSTFYCPKCQR